MQLHHIKSISDASISELYISLQYDIFLETGYWSVTKDITADIYFCCCSDIAAAPVLLTILSRHHFLHHGLCHNTDSTGQDILYKLIHFFLYHAYFHVKLIQYFMKV